MKRKAHLIIQTAFLGDLILSIPWLNRLRQTSKDQALVLVCKKGLGDFFLKEKIVDQVYEIVKGDRNTYQKILIELNQKYEFDTLFCVHRSIRSLLFSAQVQAEQKIGFSSILGFWIFDHMVHYEKNWPDPIRQWNLLTAIDPISKQRILENDWNYLNKKSTDQKLQPIPDFFQFPIQKRNSLLKKIAFFPGSVWATKKWTESGFIELGVKLNELGYQIDVMGGPDENELCKRISSQIPSSQNFSGKLSLTESIEHIRKCALVVANDSAPTHMAACDHVPVVSIFGPTTLDLGFRPWSNESRVVEDLDLDCRPCGKHGHNQCPLGHHKCMKDLSADSVLKACLELLAVYKVSFSADKEY